MRVTINGVTYKTDRVEIVPDRDDVDEIIVDNSCITVESDCVTDSIPYDVLLDM